MKITEIPVEVDFPLPPTWGRWEVGTGLVHRQTREIWICTAKGSPGTWTRVTQEPGPMWPHKDISDGDVSMSHPDGIPRMWGNGEWHVIPLRVEDCLTRGGHCWVSTGMRLASNPPQYPERCKHCPATRVGIPREPMEYRDTTPEQYR